MFTDTITSRSVVKETDRAAGMGSEVEDLHPSLVPVLPGFLISPVHSGRLLWVPTRLDPGTRRGEKRGASADLDLP